MHCGPDVDLVNEIPFWQVAVNTTHKVDHSVAKEDGVKMSLEISESLMNLGGNLDWVNEIALVSEKSFVGFISCWNTTEALNLCWKLAVISAEKTDLRWLGILEESINDSVADGTGGSSNQNV